MCPGALFFICLLASTYYWRHFLLRVRGLGLIHFLVGGHFVLACPGYPHHTSGPRTNHSTQLAPHQPGDVLRGHGPQAWSLPILKWRDSDWHWRVATLGLGTPLSDSDADPPPIPLPGVRRSPPTARVIVFYKSLSDFFSKSSFLVTRGGRLTPRTPPSSAALWSERQLRHHHCRQKTISPASFSSERPFRQRLSRQKKKHVVSATLVKKDHVFSMALATSSRPFPPAK